MTSRRVPKKVRDRNAQRRRNVRQSLATGEGGAVLPVRDGGLVDVELVRELALRETGGLPQLGDPSVDSRLGDGRLPLPVLTLHTLLDDSFSTGGQVPKRASLPRTVPAFGEMADERHKRPYPKGPRREVTPEWRARVDAVLRENASKNVSPRDRSELAREIRVHKTAMSALFGTAKKKPAQSSALVEPISKLLGIQPPTRPVNPDDELDDEISELTPKERADVLTFIRNFVRRR